MSTEKGIKLDNGKNRLGLVLSGFSHALWLVGCVGTFGLINILTTVGKRLKWQNRYLDALLRHLFKVFMGEETDKESSLPHLAHVCWNALAILELTVHEKQIILPKDDILK